MYASIILGISLWIHIQNILLVPSLCYLLWLKRPINLKSILLNLLPLIISMIALVSITLFFTKNPITSIFYQTDAVLGSAIIHDVFYYFKSTIKHLGYLIYNFHFFLIFTSAGLWYLFKKQQQMCYFLLATALPFLFFGVTFDVADSYVFDLNAYLAITIFIGLGIKYFQLRLFVLKIFIGISTILSPSIYFMVCNTALNYGLLNEWHNNKLYKGGLNYLLWPCMRNNVCVLDLCCNISKMPEKPFYLSDMQWNYDMAIEYMKLKNYDCN
jgi:hypothetical protein